MKYRENVSRLRAAESLLLAGVAFVTFGCADVRAPKVRPLVAIAEQVQSSDASALPPAPTSDSSDVAPDPPAQHATPSQPAPTFRDEVPSSLGQDAPAVRYAKLSRQQCQAEVEKRELPAARVKDSVPGVDSPMRVHGAFHGVRIQVPGEKSKFGVMDCALVLALSDLTKLVAEMGGTAIRIDNVYRVGAKLPGRRKASQHASALALDVVSFSFGESRTLGPGVWGATIGQTPCGPGAQMAEPSADAVLVRNLLCEAGRRGLFQSILSPSYDAAHQSHFHLDLKRDSTRMFVR